MNNLSLTIVSRPDNIKIVENFVEKAVTEFGISPKLYGRISMPVIECVTNPVLYGNEENKGKTIRLNARKEFTKIVVTVENDGEGVNFEDLPDYTEAIEWMEIAYRGLYLLLNLPDEVSVTDRGRKIIMTYFLNWPV